MKKLVYILLAVTLCAALLFAGCTTPTGTTTPSPDTSASPSAKVPDASSEPEGQDDQSDAAEEVAAKLDKEETLEGITYSAPSNWKAAKQTNGFTYSSGASILTVSATAIDLKAATFTDLELPADASLEDQATAIKVLDAMNPLDEDNDALLDEEETTVADGTGKIYHYTSKLGAATFEMKNYAFILGDTMYSFKAAGSGALDGTQIAACIDSIIESIAAAPAE